MAANYGFSERDARRLQRQLNQFERGRRNPPPPRGSKWPGRGWTGLLPAKNTSGGTVAAGTQASPTSFSGTLQLPSGTGFTTTGGEVISTMYNPYPGTIANGAMLWVTWFNNNIYVVGSGCS